MILILIAALGQCPHDHGIIECSRYSTVRVPSNFPPMPPVKVTPPASVPRPRAQAQASVPRPRYQPPQPRAYYYPAYYRPYAGYGGYCPAGFS